jgi:hypothetical protein
MPSVSVRALTMDKLRRLRPRNMMMLLQCPLHPISLRERCPRCACLTKHVAGVKLEDLPTFLWEEDKAANAKEAKPDAPKNA